MDKIIIIGSSFTVFVYLLAATFGYLTWVGQDEVIEKLKDTNILQIDYKGNIAFSISIFGLLFAVFAAGPMLILPSKDAYEELMCGPEGMSSRLNLIMTAAMIVICFVLAIAIPSISDIVEVLGYTTNPMIGFILPIMFYLKLNPDVGFWS